MDCRVNMSWMCDTIFFFANLLLYPPECNTLKLSTTLWLKVFVLHSFSFAVMSCTVSHLLLLTKCFKAFLSLFVKLLFLPLRFKVSTVPVLRYLLRTLMRVVLGMFNILDSSALFCTDSDRVIINSFVSVDSSAPFRLMRAENKFSEAKQKNIWPYCINLTLNLMLNKQGVKTQTALISFLPWAIQFFSCSWHGRI